MRQRISPEEARLVAAKAAALALVSGCLMVILVGTAPEAEEQADVLDTHRERMLIDSHGKGGIVTNVHRAKDWALKHFMGNLSTSRHASAYLNYFPPHREQGKIVSWYHTLVPKHSADDTYFAVQGTQFGYFGLQQVRDYPMFEGKVVFSMWDKGSAAGEQEEDMAKIVECGNRSICTRFGGEGTGAKSYINFYKWDLERTYGFLTKAVATEDDRVRLEGYFHAEEFGGWVLVSKLEARKGDLPWHINRMYSFTEQWTPRDFGEARWAKLGPSFVQWSGGEGSWTQVKQAHFTHTSTSNEDTDNVNANVTDDGAQWGLGIGGSVKNSNAKMLQITNPAHGLPEPLVEWEKLVKANDLPRGCKGHTCHHRWWIALFRENFLSSSNLPRTCAFAALFLIVMCYLVYACRVCGCCSKNDHEEHFLEEESMASGQSPPGSPMKE